MTATDLAVSCREVRKHFGDGETRIEALRGVDFSARFGELTFLVGPSGCGKTTLISVIAGLLDRTAGELAVLGTRMDDLSGIGRVLFRRQNVGFVFQQYNLLPALTAAENVDAIRGTAAARGHRACPRPRAPPRRLRRADRGAGPCQR
jgi:putative ABC transport system ATP-binding protein